MCTPWTLTRFVRWRVRDLASCFLACRFPLEEEEIHPPSSQQLAIGNMVFNTRDKKMSKKRLSRRNRCDNGKQLNQSPAVLKSSCSVENIRSDNSSCARFSDEEYIVFCFREDGAFDVVKDNNIRNSEESNQSNSSSGSRPVNRKLYYAEDAGREKKSSDVGRSKEDGNEEDIDTTKEGDGERRSMICLELEVELASGSLRRSHRAEESPPNRNRRTVSVESSDSNQSEGSTGSFAFPVLGWEWMGSPAQMPKSEGMMNPRKNKALSVRFQCFRF